jgi:ankyrin repeat protein
MLKSEEGDFDEVKKLLSDPKAFDVNAQNKNGYTALALATKGGFFEIVQSLINVGANVNVSNNVNSKNPFHPS